MNGKFITLLGASFIAATLASVPANAKTSKKHPLRCQQKNHMLLLGCLKPSANAATDLVSHGNGGRGGGGGNTYSDIRLKHDLQLVGTTVYGLPLYDFEYNGQQGTYEGVMAQDVLKVMPEAVTSGADGYYRVNYKMLGLKLKRIQ